MSTRTRSRAWRTSWGTYPASSRANWDSFRGLIFCEQRARLCPDWITFLLALNPFFDVVQTSFLGLVDALMSVILSPMAAILRLKIKAFKCVWNASVFFDVF